MVAAVQYDQEANATNSSMIDRLVYNTDEKLAVVQFSGNGSVYAYSMGLEEWNDWAKSGSVGSFYNQEVRGINQGRFLGYLTDGEFEKVAKAPTGPTVTYSFVGTITTEVSSTVEVNDSSDSFDRALAAFRVDNPGVKITSFTTV